jgi:hypothetical protein
MIFLRWHGTETVLKKRRGRHKFLYVKRKTLDYLQAQYYDVTTESLNSGAGADVRC